MHTLQTLQEPATNGSELTALLTALTALKKGMPGVRLPIEWTGVAGKVADAFNEVVEQNERMAQELLKKLYPFLFFPPEKKCLADFLKRKILDQQRQFESVTCRLISLNTHLQSLFAG